MSVQEIFSGCSGDILCVSRRYSMAAMEILIGVQEIFDRFPGDIIRVLEIFDGCPGDFC